MIKYSLKFMLVAVCTFIVACTDSENIDKNLTDKQLYEMGEKLLDNKDYYDAVNYLKTLENRYPFGQYAAPAMLDRMYAHYQLGEYDAAQALSERFIKMQKNHKEVDYAYYIKAVADMNKDYSMFDRLFTVDKSLRDAGHLQSAFSQFKELIELYPDSDYAVDAQIRMVHLKNLLANRELVTGMYYLNRKNYVAALNRAQYLLRNFQRTQSVADALALAAAASGRLNMPELQVQYFRVLKTNFPHHISVDGNNFIESSTNNFFAKLLSTREIAIKNIPADKDKQSNDELNAQYQSIQNRIIDDIGIHVGKPIKRSWFAKIFSNKIK